MPSLNFRIAIQNMSDRFFCPDLPTSGTIDLSPEESHHASSVLRVESGDMLTLFDGKGHQAEGIVVSVSKKSVELEVESYQLLSRESQRRLTVAIALPKGDRQKWLVEKCVELGVSQIQPLDVIRSVAKPEKQVVERLERQVIEASKQCRRNTLMAILPPLKWDNFLKKCGETPSNSQFWIAHPGGKSVEELLAVQPDCSDFIVAIGPEGGFAQDECQAAVDAGFSQLSLGKRILRIETAAISIAAQICN